MEPPGLPDIVADALERSGEERAKYLDEACAGNLALRARVEELLSRAESGGRFLELPAAERAATWEAPIVERPGTYIGQYKLLQQIGEGGFGRVFMAEQERPFFRRVALKIIKLGMDTRQVIARFEVERQALAMMDHPHIARVFDAGATESGRPFFVMELLRGDPITRYCDSNRLSVRDRLSLFIEVCRAVQHAHQKGIIHRDLKPSNVLVTVADGRPIPKVIDFGIAKAINARLTEKTLFTEHNALIGTPEYMSPEQADSSGTDVDTRTDIYSLGAMLYELLSGATPFDPARLRSAAWSELQRIIREVEPPRPSTRLSTLKDALGAVAERRRTDPVRLGVLIRGDLDWIVMKCLDKDRSRRYDSAGALAMDVERHLRGEPVLAAPPGAAYRFRKFVQRYRGPVIAAVVVIATIIAGTGSTIYGLFRAHAHLDASIRSEARARLEAERAERAAIDAEAARQAEAALRAVAERESEKNRVVTEFLTRTISLANPEVSPVPGLTVRALLEKAHHEAPQVLKDQPLAEAKVNLAIGKAMVALDEYDLSLRCLRRAADLLARHDPENLYDRFEAVSTLALGQARSRTASLSAAVIREATYLAPRAVESRWVRTGGLMRESLEALGARQQRRACELLRSVPEVSEEEIPHADPAWPIVVRFLEFGLLVYPGLSEEDTVALNRRVCVLRDRIDGPRSMRAAGARIDMAARLLAFGRAGEAESSAREALLLLEEILPPDHLWIAATCSLLGESLVAQGRDAEAEPFLRRACANMVRNGHFLTTGERPFPVLLGVLDRTGRSEEAGVIRREFGRLVQSEPRFIDWNTAKAAFAPEHRELVESADALLEALRRRAGEEELSRLYERLRKDWTGPGVQGSFASTLIARYVALWADIHEYPAGHFRQRLSEDAHDALMPLGPAAGVGLCNALWELHYHAMDRGDVRAAESYARRAWELSREVLGPDDPWVSIGQRLLGSALLAQRRYAEAEPLLVEAYQRQHDAWGFTANSEYALSEVFRLYEELGAPARVVPLLRECAEARDLGARPLWQAVLAEVSPSLHGELEALVRSLSERRPDLDQLCDAVRGARRLHGPRDDDPAALAYVAIVSHLPAMHARCLPDAGVLMPLLRDAEAIVRTQTGEYSGQAVQVRHAMVTALLFSPRQEEAEAEARSHAQFIGRLYGPDSNEAAEARLLIAWTLARNGRATEAMEIVQADFERRLAHIGTDSPALMPGFQIVVEIVGALPPGSQAGDVVMRLLEDARQKGTAGDRNDFAWSTARVPGLPEAWYRRALELGEAAITSDTNNPAFLSTLAMVQYRVGALEEAARTAGRALWALEESNRPAGAAEHLILAMALHRLGDAGSAREHLALGRRLVESGRTMDYEPAILAEAEAMIGFDGD